VAYGEYEKAELNWPPVAIDELPRVFREFIENVHESLGQHAGIES
jgi:hypothetical protein